MPRRGSWHTFNQEQAQAIGQVLDYLIQNAPDKETVDLAKKLKVSVGYASRGQGTIQVIDPKEEELLDEILVMLGTPYPDGEELTMEGGM